MDETLVVGFSVAFLGVVQFTFGSLVVAVGVALFVGGLLFDASP